MNFQKIVLIIATVVLIIFLLIVGYMLYKNKYSSDFPPIISDCPDYWLDMSGNDLSGNTVTPYCYNVKNLGNANCENKMDFSTSFWTTSDSLCKKQKWANGCNLTWQGITNNNNACSSSSDSNNNNSDCD
jgi:hypothetical protein